MGKWYFKYFKPSLKASEQKTWWKTAELCLSSWWDRMMCISPRSLLLLSCYNSEGTSAVPINNLISICSNISKSKYLLKDSMIQRLVKQFKWHPSMPYLADTWVFPNNNPTYLSHFDSYLYSNFGSWNGIRKKNPLHLVIQLTRSLVLHILPRSKLLIDQEPQ